MVSTVRESEDTKDAGSQAAAPERRRLGLRRGTCATSTAQAPNQNIPLLRVSREAKAKPAWASWRHVAHSRRRPTGFAHDTHMHARAPGSPLPASAWAQMRSRELTRASDRIRGVELTVAVSHGALQSPRGESAEGIRSDCV